MNLPKIFFSKKQTSLNESISSNYSERDLIEQCIADNRQSQEILYRQYADNLYTVCLIYAKSEEDACDVLQESFIKIFRNLSQFNFTGSFEGWLRRIVVNTALEHYRKKKREIDNRSVYQTCIEPLTEGILDAINAKELVKLVNKLPPQAGMVLKLFAIEGYPHKEIAKIMSISEGTSKSQLNYARTLLKQSINKHNG